MSTSPSNSTAPALTPELEAKTVRNYPADWSDLDTKAIDTVRAWLNYFDEKFGSGLMKKLAGMVKHA